MSSTRALARIALRNTRKNWRHSLASALSIALALVAFGLFDGYMDDVTGRLLVGFTQRSMYGDVLVERTGASSDEGRDDPQAVAMNERQQAWLDGYLQRHRDQLTARARFVNFSGMANAGRASTLFAGLGYDVLEGEKLRDQLSWNVIAGQPLDPNKRDQVALGRRLSIALDCDPPPGPIPTDETAKPVRVARPMKCARTDLQLTAMTPKGQLNAVGVEIQGVLSITLREVDEIMLMVPLEVAQSLVNDHGVSLYSIRLKKGGSAKAFAADLAQEARRAGLDLWAGPWQAHRSALVVVQSIEMMQAFRGLILLIVMIVSAMSVASSMAKAVSERTREIGALRSFGYMPRHVLVLFGFEALWLALPSLAFGVVFTLAAAWGVNMLHLTLAGPVGGEPNLIVVHVTALSCLGSSVFLALVTLGATLLVARRGAHAPITAALGHT